MRLHPYSYHIKSTEQSLYERDIIYDIDRTFCNNGYFETSFGRDSLKKVLIAISNTRKDVGYIQGLNCIVGQLLLYLSEEESYWTILYFMEKLDVKNLFNGDFKNINILNYQLQTFCEFYLPEIINYLKQRNMEISYFSTAWFITLFSNAFSHKFVIKCWCVFLLKGFPFLIKLALAIFALHKDDIIIRDCDEAGEYLKDAIKSTEAKIFELATRFKVTKRLLDTLRHFYDSPRKPKLRLVPIGKKLDWREFTQTNHDTNNITIEPPKQKTPKSPLNSCTGGTFGPILDETKDSNDTKKVLTKNFSVLTNHKLLNTVMSVIKIDVASSLKYIFPRKSTPNLIKQEKNRSPEYDKTRQKTPTNHVYSNGKTRSNLALMDFSSQESNSIKKLNECKPGHGGLYTPESLLNTPKIRLDPRNNLERYKINPIYDTIQSEESELHTSGRANDMRLSPNNLKKIKKQKIKLNGANIMGDIDSAYPGTEMSPKGVIDTWAYEMEYNEDDCILNDKVKKDTEIDVLKAVLQQQQQQEVSKVKIKGKLVVKLVYVYANWMI